MLIIVKRKWDHKVEFLFGQTLWQSQSIFNKFKLQHLSIYFVRCLELIIKKLCVPIKWGASYGLSVPRSRVHQDRI